MIIALIVDRPRAGAERPQWHGAAPVRRADQVADGAPGARLLDGQRAEHARPRGGRGPGRSRCRCPASALTRDRVACPSWRTRSRRASGPVAAPVPCLIARLCDTPDMLVISIVTAPAVAVVALFVRRRAGRSGWRRIAACPPSRSAGLPAPGACTAACPSRPVSCARRAAACCDVGGDVGRRGAAGEALRHHALGVGVSRSALRRCRGSTLRPKPFDDALGERFVEVGPDDALGVGPRERVAGAALGDELPACPDQVGVVVALDRHRSRRASEREAAARLRSAQRRRPARARRQRMRARGGS